MRLSDHFDSREFACKDGCGLWVAVNARLLTALEEMRERVGPIRITSGVRCVPHNRQVGGVPDSEHLTGEGADLFADTAQARFALVDAAIAAGVTRIGIADRFVHVGVAVDRPQHVCWIYGPSRFAA